MKMLKKTPMAVCSIALALAALGNLLLPYGEAVRYICGILSGLILVLFILKIIFDFEQVKSELKNPIVLSVLPTSTMALMLLCVYVKPFIGFAAVVVWYAAIALHVLIMLLFAKRFVMAFDLKNVFPSWFVVCAGIAAAAVTSPAMDAKPLGQIAVWIGLALYIVALPIVIYRMIKLKPMPEPARPTIAIFTAPVSLCLAGYMSAFEQPNAVLVYILLALAVASYLYVTVCMIFLLRLKFYPTCAAFTFPYVISAVAFKAANNFLVKNDIQFFGFVPKAAEWIAIAAVVYVLVRYIMFIVKQGKTVVHNSVR